MNKALIADIQRASFHDGAGIRTTVFFKGCPLSCAWCHNPECISFEKQTLFYPNKCISCGKCDEGCFSGARVICGKEYTAADLTEEILRDRSYYGNRGGVTFSGGEPLTQAVFLNEMLDILKHENINRAAETSLVYYNEEIFKKLDFVMADLKIWDNELHRQFTGVGNTEIKENFKRLDSLNIPIIARTPVIPGIKQDIDKISEFLYGLKNVGKYELLPYHPLGLGKARALGIEQRKFEIPSERYVKELDKYVFIRQQTESDA